MNAVRLFAFIVAVFAVPVFPEALAQEPAFVGKEEMTTLVIGKTVSWVRERDGTHFWWAIKADGSFDTATQDQRTRKAYKDNGKWELRPDGGLCMTYSERSSAPCVAFFFQKKGDKYDIFTSRKPGETRFAEVSSIR